MRQNNIKTNNVLVKYASFMLLYISFSNICINYRISVGARVLSITQKLLMIGFIIIFVVYKHKYTIQKNQLPIFAFFVVEIIGTMLGFALSTKVDLFQLIEVSTWFFVYYALIKSDLASIDWFAKRTFIHYIIIYVTYVVMSYLNSEVARDVGQAVNSIYYLVFLIPFILLGKGKLKKIIAIILLVPLTIISQKRGALLCLVLGLIAYWLVTDYIENKLRMKQFLLFIAGSVALIVFLLNYDDIMNYLYITTDYKIFRMLTIEKITETGGSGRDVIWQNTIERFSQSNFFEKMLGHGYLSTISTNSRLKAAAHNDFLEILFDFGIIGALLYLFLYLSVIKFGLLLLKKRNRYSASFITSIVVYAVASNVGSIFVYPRYMLYMVAFWSCIYVKKHRY